MVVFLAPGASGSIESMRPHIDGLRRRGVEARAVGLPKGSAERALPVYRAALADAGVAAARAVIGGHSFGGRVASLLAADEPVAGLVLLSYPLHRPGHGDDPRIEHWPRIGCPTLLISGEADPFARIDLLRDSVDRLTEARLFTFPRVGHGLVAVLDEALDRIAEFVGRLDQRSE